MPFAGVVRRRLSFVFAITLSLGCWGQDHQDSPPPPAPAQNPSPASPQYTPVGGPHGAIQSWVDPSKLDFSSMAKCSNNAPGGYPNNRCYVEVDRNLPISPPTLFLPKHTHVYIRLQNAHWDETIAFNNTVVQAAPQDLAADALKSLVTPGSAFAGAFQNKFLYSFSPNQANPSEAQPEQSPYPMQAEIAKRLDDVTPVIQNAVTALTCLETYKPALTDQYGTVYCDQTGALGPGDFVVHDHEEAPSQPTSAIDSAISYSNAARDATLPAFELGSLDGWLKNEISTCSASDLGDKCYKQYDKAQSTEAVLDGRLTALQAAQSTIVQALHVLLHWPSQNGPLGVVFDASMPKNVSSSIVITGTEAVTRTSTTIATVTISTVTTKFILSSGLLYSTAPFKTYSLGNVFVNGVLQTTTGPSGSPTPVVEVVKSKSVPSIDFPLVMGSMIIPQLSRAHWENRCRNHCEILFSTGIGLNLGGKTADLFGGPSFEFGGFLITAGALGARQNQLLDGVYTGQKNFGGTNPTTLPTSTYWSCGAGIAFTYTIPTP